MSSGFPLPPVPTINDYLPGVRRISSFVASSADYIRVLPSIPGSAGSISTITICPDQHTKIQDETHGLLLSQTNPWLPTWGTRDDRCFGYYVGRTVFWSKLCRIPVPGVASPRHSCYYYTFTISAFSHAHKSNRMVTLVALSYFCWKQLLQNFSSPKPGGIFSYIKVLVNYTICFPYWHWLFYNISGTAGNTWAQLLGFKMVDTRYTLPKRDGSTSYFFVS